MKRQQRPIISHNNLLRKTENRPQGYIKLLRAAETSEDIFRIAYMSEKHSEAAKQDIKDAGMMRSYQIWKYITMKNERNKPVETKAMPYDAVLAAVPSKKAKCYNCKHASPGFKIAGKTHHQCNHPKHEEGFKSGELSPWDTLQEFYNTCDSHEFR